MELERARAGVARAAVSWTSEAIVAGLRGGMSEATVALYDRIGERVNRLVWRLLGADPEHDDVVHQVFVNALSSIGRLKSPAALDRWIVAVTLNTVRRELRHRRYRRLLRLRAPSRPVRAPEPDPERQMVARRFYAALERVDATARIAFTLHVVEGCQLGEVAAACGCSLATAKRRCARAAAQLARAASKDPVLAAWRWSMIS